MKGKIKELITIIVIVIVIFIIMVGFTWAVVRTGSGKNKFDKCIERYPLDSCELYECRANHSSTLTSANFNIRNYEICKIILNNNMNFSESLDLLNTVRE